MIKVCHITSAHNSNDVRIFHKECASLAEAGYEVYLVAPGESGEEKGVHIVGIGERPSSRIKRMTGFAKKAYQTDLALDCEVYHIHDPELLPYALKLKKRGKKVIFDSHEYYPAQIAMKPYFPRCVRGIVSGLYTAYETHVFKTIDCVFIPCTMNGKDVLEHRTKHHAIITNDVVIPSHGCVDITKNPDMICYAGALSPDRGITNLILAADLAGIRLVLAGRFETQAYKEKLESMKEYSSVDYRGVLPYGEVMELYSHCKIGCQVILPKGQYYSGDVLGVKVTEYMALGLPVILSDTPYMKKVVAQYRCGICVDPTDPHAIAAAIRYILDHPEEAAQMGRNGRAAVEAEFNWGIQEKRLLNAYREILA